MINKNNTKAEAVGWESPVAVHPGIYLTDFLEEFSMTQDELAKRTDLHPKTINEIIKGKANITNLTALKLSKVFPVSEAYWNSLQEIYLSDLARLEESQKISEEIEVYLPKYRETYKELEKFNFVEKYNWTEKNFENIVKELHKYFGANSLFFPENEFNLGTAFRTYKKKNINPLTVAAWIRTGERKAISTKVSSFNLTKLKSSIQTIRSYSLKHPDEYLPLIEKELAECGVVLVYMPYFKNSHTQGAVRWLSKDKVLLMLNTNKRSEDKFWFNLFHELGHIIKHGKINKEDRTKMYLDLDDAQDNEIEKEADEFAQKTLIPDFISRYQRLFSDYKDYRKGIIELSSEVGIAPAIFAGQTAHKLNEAGNNVYGNRVLSEFWSKRTINYSNL